MSRATTVLVMGAMPVALAVGVALGWMIIQGPDALAEMIPCSGTSNTCRGTDNPDRIVESSVDDRIRAEGGGDDVDAAWVAGDTDRVSGGDGDDTINTADGDPFDTIRCGEGQDVAIFTPGDDVAGSCENTSAAGGPRPPSPP